MFFNYDDSGRESFMSKVNKIVFIYPLPAAKVRRFLKRKVGRVDEGKRYKSLMELNASVQR